MLNVLIVEDQSIVRQGLKLMLQQDEQIRVVAEAENGEEAINKMESHVIDVVLMDIRMPVMNGLEATRKIKECWPNVKILILTTFNDDEYAIQALKYGANAFLLKTSDQQTLIHAVHSCFQGGLPIHEEVVAKVMPRLLHKVEKKLELPLSARELDITRLVGEGKTNKEIADQLYLSIGTVKNHITQILQKLELRDRTQLAIFAVKNDIT
ncbi:response regulator transcription factor [Bacillus timonensis]|uniref:Response regulator transcription factor n=1 Tax=Bacillus timonensis TaxID=1033734 RepID=A0A4S3PNJ1_9BACI|nr:response regulator transcription factor [Bacillus timonensis]THE10824.1 response regulator transcription factor [Bacillus timonensis]